MFISTLLHIAYIQKLKFKKSFKFSSRALIMKGHTYLMKLQKIPISKYKPEQYYIFYLS